jgi:tRNA(fMet)-specific endonuclease VapC
MSSPVQQIVVVDTDIVSYLFKSDTRAFSYRRHLDGRLLYVSFMTIAELEQWALLHRWGARRRAELEAHLDSFTVSEYQRELCGWWAEASVRARRSGRPIQSSDAWIAATTLLLDAPLVTHNPNDFAGVTGLSVISEARP